MVYVGIMGMTRAVWVGQERVWVGHSIPGLIAKTASVYIHIVVTMISSATPIEVEVHL